ncbi:hypothetical protein M407DRAFT_12751 [Tulasnella calospora MUT 4182]|uniref:DUF6532 domain-containing protein n=1 Tax=Tulasnella calospora MUT 4182 TaxID=1051891 RepID=A0A0C3Q1R2_9AGAM|nr:hypothetical protein M407DRAFT_12751 [Tulasnella calospora MUT 4182]
MTHPQPGLPAIPPSQPGYPNLVPTAAVPTEMTRSSAVPPSSVVPMAIWSHSASPHGGSLDATTTPSSAVQHQAPLASGLLQTDAGFASEEDDDDILTPFSPVIQPTSLQPAPSSSQASQQLHVHRTILPESSTDANSNTSSRQSSEVPEEDDVLEALRTKARRRRRPQNRIALANTDPSNAQASLEKIDADPTNLYAYSDQERPILHLARVLYGALLVTKEAMPNLATARAFQIEAYHEAGRILNTGIPSTLPGSPSNTILRLIAKHASAIRGRLKTAALNALILDYGIKGDGRDTTAIASRVADLLNRKNFTYREVTAQGRAGIFRNPAIANVLLGTLFRDRESEGVLAKHLFLPLIPEGAIFMACTAIEHALEMWSTGVKVSRDFSNDHARRQIWTRHKNTWYDYIERKGEAGANYAQETREMITSQIRSVLDGLNPISSQSATVSDAESFFDDADAD